MTNETKRISRAQRKRESANALELAAVAVYGAVAGYRYIRISLLKRAAIAYARACGYRKVK